MRPVSTTRSVRRQRLRPCATCGNVLHNVETRRASSCLPSRTKPARLARLNLCPQPSVQLRGQSTRRASERSSCAALVHRLYTRPATSSARPTNPAPGLFVSSNKQIDQLPNQHPETLLTHQCRHPNPDSLLTSVCPILTPPILRSE